MDNKRIVRLNENIAQNEENLRLFRLSGEQSGEGVFRMDRQAKFIYVNNYASEMLGYTEHELLNMGDYDIDPFFA